MARRQRSEADLLRTLTELAQGLRPEQARLYSLYTTLRGGGSQLKYSDKLARDRLDDAVRMIGVALSPSLSPDAPARRTEMLLRAAELLEWLSPVLGASWVVQSRLSAAAAYQLAGYPARASALLAERVDDEAGSRMLSALLGGDVLALESETKAYWSQKGVLSVGTEDSGGAPPTQYLGISERLVGEIAKALGVVAASVRWGDDGRATRAIEKLRGVARVMQHSSSDSWLLANLCAEAMSVMYQRALRPAVAPALATVSAEGKGAFERYVRMAIRGKRAQAWPSQVRGLSRLAEGGSFALCTPTGSGKTAIAEMALLQGLFGLSDDPSPAQSKGDELVLYLTPSRALAAEVETKLSSLFGRLGDATVTVTGLYGGSDWGPTDAWLTLEGRAVVVCTYHKAEALLRHLGHLFVGRVKMVVVDEAHNVLAARGSDWESTDHTALTVESLMMRLRAGGGDRPARVIALSAVASGSAGAIARWAEGNASAEPVTEQYRSTRQLIGRLAFNRSRSCSIRYDLLDSRSLQFSERDRDDTPYLPTPFPPFPPTPELKDGPDLRVRPPTLWGAMHLAAPEGGMRKAVLVSITQKPEEYAATFLDLLDNQWAGVRLPNYFDRDAIARGPTAELWLRARAVCIDYFGEESFELRLLDRGIVLHHGKMPSHLSRLLTQLIERRVVNVVAATSTLSEGVNLPFEIVIVPVLRRGSEPMKARELSNLIGRAGRPGVAVEGTTLVVLSDRTEDAWRTASYFRLISEIQEGAKVEAPVQEAGSALGKIMANLESQWELRLGSAAKLPFEAWLEEVVPLDAEESVAEMGDSLNSLGELDRILLAVASELDLGGSLAETTTALEARLTRAWRTSFAHASAQAENRWESAFVRRGIAIPRSLYPDATERRKLYRSTLLPQDARALVQRLDAILRTAKAGEDYAVWTREQQLEFVESLLSELFEQSVFAPPRPPAGAESWRTVLRWWLRAPNAIVPSGPKAITKWYKYVSEQFVFKASWAIGCALGLATSDPLGGLPRTTQLSDWPSTGLPWCVFWLRDVLTWGTLDPVAAYLLSYRIQYTRAAAEDQATTYYAVAAAEGVAAKEILDASRVRAWGVRLRKSAEGQRRVNAVVIGASLEAEFDHLAPQFFRVSPCVGEDRIEWIDCCGLLLATSEREVLESTVIEQLLSAVIDCVLDRTELQVRITDYVAAQEQLR